MKLDEAGDLAAIYRAPRVWDKVLSELKDEAMPPDDKPQPSAEEAALTVYDALVRVVLNTVV